jgi:hypothetical protein
MRPPVPHGQARTLKIDSSASVSMAALTTRGRETLGASAQCVLYRLDMRATDGAITGNKVAAIKAEYVALGGMRSSGRYGYVHHVTASPYWASVVQGQLIPTGRRRESRPGPPALPQRRRRSAWAWHVASGGSRAGWRVRRPAGRGLDPRAVGEAVQVLLAKPVVTAQRGRAHERPPWGGRRASGVSLSGLLLVVITRWVSTTTSCSSNVTVRTLVVVSSVTPDESFSLREWL